MKLIYSSFFALFFLHIAAARRSRQVSGGQERGGVGIQLPSISLWPWRDSRQHRAATFSVKNQIPAKKYPGNYPAKQVSQRRQETPNKRLPQSKSQVIYKKPTGLEKKPFGAKYPSKQQILKYQKYHKTKPPPPKKVRFAPIPDLRPTSIDRIDILRPQKLPRTKQPAPRPLPPRTPPPPSPGPPRHRQLSTPRAIPILSGIKIQEPAQQSTKIVKYVPNSVNSIIDSNAIINFTESPVEVDGLKLFMFRGDEGIGGSFQPLASPSVRVASAGSRGQYQPHNPGPQRPGPSSSPFQWSRAEVRPAQSPVSTPRPREDVPPPFPTRHTTPSPHISSHKPVVIIAQSNVAQNN